MNNRTKIALAALLLFVMPLGLLAQPVHLTKVSELNIHNYWSIEERVALLHSIQQSDVFSYIYNDNTDRFDIFVPADYSCDDESQSPDFEMFLDNWYNEWVAYSNLDKNERGALFVQWRSQLENNVFTVVNDDFHRQWLSRDGNASCDGALPFCTDNGLYNFPASVDAGNLGGSGTAPYYCSNFVRPNNMGTTSCLYTTPNPAFYFMRISEPGNLNIYMHSEPSYDIDFDCWGPFDNIDNACDQISCDNMVDCSYSTSATENCIINNAQPGQYYILLITNYSNDVCNILFENTGGGATDCSILPPVVDAGGPYCVGETINLTANGQSGASYSWTGPGGYTSNQQNPTRPNCTMAMAGTYTCTITVGSQTNNATTAPVVVYAQPTANFTATSVCEGSPTQFTSTSTTNPAGQNISSYVWDFDDGQNGTGQTTTHTYAQAGTYNVTLSTSCGGHCTSEKTQTVTVHPAPTANFTATTVCQGNPTQFTSTSAGQGITSYQWNFGDNQTGTGQNASHTYAQPGTYNVTLTVAGAGGCSDDITQTVTVNPSPTAAFTATTVCQGTPTQFTSTSTGQGITSFQWNFGDGQTGTGQSVTHNYANPGTYNVTLTVQATGGCSNTTTQTVRVNAMPVAAASAQPSTVLYGGTSTLTANAGAQGTFDFHWEPANMVTDPNSQTTQTVALQQSQTYTVTITNPQGGCTSTAQVTVSLDGSGMTVMANADQTDLCDGESTIIHALPSGGTDNYTYSWSPAGTLSNANIQHPVATPPVGNTTYTCHVSDGFTDIDVSVTLHVHPNVEYDIYQTVCENDTYNFYGQDLQAPGVYNHTLSTQHGCDSILHLHLDNWQTYETPITEHFCQGDQFEFYDQTISNAGTYYHTLESVHGCDSVIKLNLIQDPVYEFEMWESTCEGGPGYYFAGQYLQPQSQPYVFPYPTSMNCDSIIRIHVEEAEYNSKNYNVSLCGTEYTWASNGVTYYETGIYYDTLHFENTCDSTVVLNLELRPNYNDEVVTTSCDTYRWKDDNYNVDMTFTESTDYTHHYINAYGCESEVTLHLSINDHDETTINEETCDSLYWAGDYYTMRGTYEKTFTNHAGCDSIVTMHLEMEYTPHPTAIYPMDNNNTAPHWVVTSTEFQVNTYDFNLWDVNPNCYWDTVYWSCENAPSWLLEPFGNKGKNCKLYVLNHVPDTVWLTARIENKCAMGEENIIQKYWMVCSFYDIDEQANSPANFDVIPNPNKGQMTLNFEHLTGKINIKVYDMRGALIDDFETYNDYGPSTYTYNMKNQVEGIYFFVATSKEGAIAKKVIIQR